MAFTVARPTSIMRVYLREYDIRNPVRQFFYYKYSTRYASTVNKLFSKIRVRMYVITIANSFEQGKMMIAALAIKFELPFRRNVHSTSILCRRSII